MDPMYRDFLNIPVFTTEQIDLYGPPESNGFTEKYWVIDSEPKYLPPRKIEHFVVEKPIHRYDRVERFQRCLKQLLGITGVIGKSLADIDSIMRDEVYNYQRQYMPQCMVWGFFRKILFKHKRSSFYNRIPAIAKGEGLHIQNPIITKRLFNLITSDFEQMHDIFPRIRHKLNRKYFPSIRAVCLLLMERYKIPNVFHVPIAQTLSKAKDLRTHFELIWDEINIEMTDMLFG